MPLTWLDPKATVPYVLREQRGAPEAERVTFHLGVLTTRQYAQVEDALRVRAVLDGQDVTLVRTGTFAEQYTRLGLRGWAGPEGTPPFTKGEDGVMTEDCLRLLPGNWRQELGNAVHDLNTLGADAVKG